MSVSPTARSLDPDACPAPIVVLDAEGRVLHWNPACAEVAPCVLEDARGRLLAELGASPADAAGLARAVAEARGGARAAATCRWAGRGAPPRVMQWAISSCAADRVLAVGLDVTEVHRARDAEVERARALQDRAPIGIFVADLEGHIEEVNQAGCRMLGRTREELIGKTPLDVVAPEDHPRLAALRERLLAGESHTGEWTLVRPDGSRVPVELSTHILPDGQWQAFVLDVRERRAHDADRERRLRESDAERRWLRAVIDTVPAAVLLYGPGGELVFNRHAEKILGIELTGSGGVAQYASRILHRDGTPVAPDELVSSRVLREPDPIVAAEFLVEQPDGTRVPILGSAAAIRDERGAIIGRIGVFQDVSERMRDGEAMRANERLLDGIFELLPVGVWIADRTGRIVRTNPAGLQVWEGARYVGPSEFDQYQAWWADTGEPIAADEWALARALRSGETSLGEILRIRCFDGSEKTIINSAMPLRDEQGAFAGAIVVNEDITALRETEDALRRAVLARDEVLGVVAHDLRSPLNAIVMQLQLLRRAASADAAVRKAAELVERQAGRMDRLIQDLLEVARIDAGRLAIERARVRAAALVEDVVEPLRPIAAEGSLELTTDVADGLGDVWGDRERLARALENLIRNAMKFTAPGGTITVRAAPGDGEIVLSVADTGAGIDEDHLAHVFDRFWQRAEGDRRGAGLGLAIVKGIAEAHGGKVWAESRVGAGSTFSVAVPRAPSEPRERPTPAAGTSRAALVSRSG